MIRRILNPLDRTAGYGLPHALVIASAVILAFSAGWFGGSRYTARYFVSHYRAPIQVPATRANTHRTFGTAPAAATLDMAHWPGIFDQGTTGSCAAHASVEDLSYLYRESHLSTHPAITFSPRWAYDYYSDRYNNGQDGGSWPDQDLEVVRSQGIPQRKLFSYPPYVVDPQLPAGAIATNAAKFIMPLTVSDLVYGLAPGQSAIDAIRSIIASGRPALLSIEVTPAFDNATATGGYVDEGPGASSRGGHEVVGVSFDDASQTVTIANSWGTYWGQRGFARLSYRYIEQYAFGVQAVSLG